MDSLIPDKSNPWAAKLYDDLGKPVVAPFGKILSYPSRVIYLLTSQFDLYLHKQEKLLEAAMNEIDKKTKGMTDEQFSPPLLNIAVPAIKRMALSLDIEELRDLYTTLLVTSMKNDTHNSVMPAFVDVISQLTSDEAKLLKYIVNNGNKIAACEIRMFKSHAHEDGFEIAADNILNLPENLLFCPENEEIYISNMARLGLIDVPKGLCINNDDLYVEIEQGIHDKAISEGFDDRIQIIRKMVRLTKFGIAFADVCIEDSFRSNSLEIRK